MKNQKMPGDNPKSYSDKPSPSSSQRKTRWESATNLQSSYNSVPAGDSKTTKPSSTSKDDPAPRPSPAQPNLSLNAVPPSGPGPFPPSGAGARFPFPDPAELGPPFPPAYGFHMLERRTIVLAEGNVRSYFALPPGYQDFPVQGRPMNHPSDRFSPLGFEQGDPGLGFDRRFPPGGPLSPEGFRRGLQESSLKRKYGDVDERDEFARQRQQLLQCGNPNGFPLGSGDRGDYLGGTSSPFRRELLDPRRGIVDLRSSKQLRIGGDYENLPSQGGVLPSEAVIPKVPDVDPDALKKEFLVYSKLINVKPSRKSNYLEDGKLEPLKCLACANSDGYDILPLSFNMFLLFFNALDMQNYRKSKDFPDMHGLIMHTYYIQNADLRVNHLGLHKALCVLMGWNYAKPPENSKAYQSLSADEAAENKDDLVMWPPLVIIRNTSSGIGKDGRMEGFGNKVIDKMLRGIVQWSEKFHICGASYVIFFFFLPNHISVAI
ncbi:hypothetical protein HHK36_020610 [Tetracentron sinense]|uniref:XS domain-containing protein n=1 Tax=Tetracentron sinense TaxID=13715 RepID=A0A834Z031_TETSI|nr:hypothetical protein HHK36_020610 [Tetracentron sinense]